MVEIAYNTKVEKKMIDGVHHVFLKVSWTNYYDLLEKQRANFVSDCNIFIDSLLNRLDSGIIEQLEAERRRGISSGYLSKVAKRALHVVTSGAQIKIG